MSLLRLENLSLRFGGLTAVNDISLEIKKGEIFSIIGPNGAGKTSLFNAISGIYVPTEGKIFFKGKRLIKNFNLKNSVQLLVITLISFSLFVVICRLQTIWEIVINNNYVYQEVFPWEKARADFREIFLQQITSKEVFLPLILTILSALAFIVVWKNSRISPEHISKSGIARTFQNIRLFPKITVWENILIALENFSKDKKIAEDLLELVNLKSERNLLAENLPYGMQRRLEIARALAMSPEALLLDEPAAGMNPTESSELMKLIKKIQERGITVVLIEHHMKVVMGISNRIVVLDYGNKIAEGSPEEIKNNKRVIEAYLGKSN